ncbi:MAG: MFS transporter [Xanthomonadales bacterium]|nr:MFS transporter [Xanthomonadales bacterium]MDL1867834.1 peptide MFS transporter [Gammaproteobacteria bacterium PRO6]
MATTTATPSAPPQFPQVLGHPRPLWMLFMAEFWERFAYYGMRALLAVYVAAQFFAHLPEGEAKTQASLVYGGYTSLVYATGVIGGMIADRYLGYQRSIILGGLIMAAGLFLLLLPELHWFLIGLAVIVAGNGLFKPNISTMIGKLYGPNDVRRDSGFTIFYMGINAGAFFAPIVCGSWIGAHYGYQYGFLAAALGMILGVMVFQFRKGMLQDVGRAPAGREGIGPILTVLAGAAVMVPVIYFLLSKSDVLGVILLGVFAVLAAYLIWSGFSQDRVQGQKYVAMFILFSANILFWSLFEQAGASLNFLAEEYVSAPFHFTLFQSANPMFILLLAPLFAMMWPKLEKVGMNPSIPRKFAIALIGLAAGFALLVFAIKTMAGADGKIGWYWLLGLYFLHTAAELCLSPIGLSMVTKLAAPRNVGLSMGGWFLATAVANYLAGRISAIASGGGHGEHVASSLAQYAATFTWLIWAGLAVGAVFFLLAPLINRLMHGVK